MNELKKNIIENYHQFDVLQLIDIIRENFSDGDIYFETEPSFAFPPSDISSININSQQQTTLRLPVMNSLGITTTLPIGFTDYANRDRKGSKPLQAFLSIMQNRFHHMWITVLRKYDIWHNAGSPAMRIFEWMSARLIEQFEDYDLFWLSAFSHRTRNAADLKRIIRSIWKEAPVRIEENIGRWTVVENRYSLGHGLRLGRRAAIIGSKIFDRTATFRISLGPVDIDTYKSFFPGLSGNQLLKNIISLYINEPLICELEVSCRLHDLEPAKLGKTSSEDIGGLGRTMILGQYGKNEGKDKNDDDKIHRYRTVIFEKFENIVAF